MKSIMGFGTSWLGVLTILVGGMSACASAQEGSDGVAGHALRVVQERVDSPPQRSNPVLQGSRPQPPLRRVIGRELGPQVALPFQGRPDLREKA